jgi:hypothetical protein
MKKIFFLLIVLEVVLLFNACQKEEKNDCNDDVQITGSSITESFQGQESGEIVVTATGGSSLTYSLNNGPFQPSNIFTKLAPGDYTIKVKSGNECSDLLQVTVGINPDPCAGKVIVITTSSTDPGAYQTNGTITAAATGATGFTYSLNAGPFQNNGTFSSLSVGTYTITAKSIDGCIGTKDITLNDPCGTPITVTANKTDPAAYQNNGSITVTSPAGPGFNYSKDGTTFQASPTFSGLAPGTYTIVAKSTVGCIGQAQFILTDPCAGVVINVTYSSVAPSPSLNNGSITVTAPLGAQYTYSKDGTNFQQSPTFSGLAAGNYTIITKTTAGCKGQVSITLNNACVGVIINVIANKTEPAAYQNNGSITVTSPVGTGYTYSRDGTTFQANPTFSGLAPGTYTIVAKSPAGCTGQTQVTLLNPCSVPIVITETITNVTPCSTPAANGGIAAVATGGTGFMYSLNGGAYQASGTFTGLAAGAHTITARNSAGCFLTKTVTIGTKAAGPLFSSVRLIVTGTKCSTGSCHNGSTAKNINFKASDCNIISNGSRIHSTTINSSPVAMPPPGGLTLTAAEKQAIINWATAGYAYDK